MERDIKQTEMNAKEIQNKQKHKKWMKTNKKTNKN